MQLTQAPKTKEDIIKDFNTHSLDIVNYILYTVANQVTKEKNLLIFSPIPMPYSLSHYEEKKNYWEISFNQALESIKDIDFIANTSNAEAEISALKEKALAIDFLNEEKVI